MTTLHLPWLELTILLPLLGALCVSRIADPEAAQRHSVVWMGAALLSAVAAWLDFSTLHAFEAHDRWDLASRWLGPDAIVIDELSAPLLPLAALLYFLTALVTLRTKVRRFSFGWTLASEALLLALLSCQHPWGVIGLLSSGIVPPLIELRARRRPTRTYVLHMGLCVVLLVAGQTLLSLPGVSDRIPLAGVWMLTAAVLIRSGIAPLHCWMVDLFEHATFGTALLFVTPMAGAYAAIRLVLPVAPDAVLRWLALLSLATAVYAAGMALVQREARRFFSYLFLSQSSLVLVGLEMATPVALTGALLVWLSVGLALAGFGLTLRSMEARLGRIALDGYRGMYDHTPRLAALFLITGLASVGFPGTIGFIGMELLVDGVGTASPVVGGAVVLAAALNSMAVLQAYFRLFTGTRHVTSIALHARRRERLAVLALTLLILGGGLYPQPGVASRHHAAMHLVQTRRHLSTVPDAGPPPDSRPAAPWHTSTEDAPAPARLNPANQP